MKIISTLLIFYIAFFTHLAFGEEPGLLKLEDIYELSIEELMEVEVITATKTPQKISDAPANMMVITKQQIKERGYVNLLDLLEDLPNVDVNNKSGEELFNQISFRGKVNNYDFIIMQDGQRISSPTNEYIPVADNFPLYHAKQVEVIFGPGSALYGADAFTGVINIITEDAEETDGMILSSSIGQYGYYYNYLHFGKKLAKNVDFSFGGHWYDSDNADLSKYHPGKFAKANLTTFGNNTVRTAANREDYYFGTGSYSSFAKLNINDQFVFGFNQSYFRHPTTNGVRPSQSIFGSEAKWETLIRNYYGEYNFGVTEKLSGKSTISYLTYEVLPESLYKNIYVNFENGYKYAHSKKFMLEQQINYKLSDNHSLVGGIAWEDFYSLPKTADLSTPYKPNLPSASQGYTYPGTNGAIPVQVYELNYSNTSGYIQLQSQWTDIISSTLGVRFDYNTRYGETINPRAGLILKPWEPTTLKILYGESYLAPPPNTAFGHFANFNGTTNANGQYISSFSQLPNPDLMPEKSRTSEFSLTHKFTPALTTSLNGYYTWYKNLIYGAFSNTPNYSIPGGEVLSWLTLENLGNSEIYGGDVRLDYHKDFGRLNMKFWGNYSFVDGWVDDGSGTKVELTYIANHKIKGGFTATWKKKYFITPMVRWIGETNHQRVSPNNPRKRIKVDDYVLVNLHCGVNDLFIEGLSAYVNVRNLLDARYSNAGGGSINFISSPQDPIRVTGTLEYKF